MKRANLLTFAQAIAVAAAGMAGDAAVAAREYLNRPHYSGGGWGLESPRPKRVGGARSVAQAKRDARKRRNVLRAKGHHKQARR